MGHYFKIINKKKNRRTVVDAPVSSHVLYSEIESIVGMLPCPENGIPHALRSRFLRSIYVNPQETGTFHHTHLLIIPFNS